MPSLGFLFLKVLRLGATAYGDPGMISQIKETFVNKYHWVEEGDFMRGLALCQLTPGATMVQMVTYSSYHIRGIWGAVAAGLAFVPPAFFAMLVLSAIYFKLQTLYFMQVLFKGLGAIVVAIVFNTCITFGRTILKDWKTALISLLSFVGFFMKWNILLIFFLAAMSGLLLRPKTYPKPAPFGERSYGRLIRRKELLALSILAACILGILAISYVVDLRLATLFLSLTKIGALAFGGGYTAIALIQYEMIDRSHWLATKEFLDGIALGQVTPGPVLITATFVGYKISGLLGAFMATLGAFFPSFFILILLIPYHYRLGQVEKVRFMEQGVLGSFVGILALVLFNFGRASFVDIQSILIAIGAFFAIHKKIGLPYVLTVGAVVSVILFGLLK